jgi:hypothetical protein
MLSVARLAENVVKLWLSIAARFQQVWRSLIALRNALLIGRVAVVAGIVLLLLLVRSWPIEVWNFYTKHSEALTPALAPLGTILVGLGTFAIGIGTMRVNRQQAKTSAQQAVITAFYNAVSRLASDKIEERLGGIYMLERISRDSPDDHWTVMETLTAFVRERTRAEAERLEKPLEQRKAELAHRLWEEAGRPEGRCAEFWNKAVDLETYGEPPATDIAAVLMVIARRSEDRLALERRGERVLDLGGAGLRKANLSKAHLQRANLTGTHLERADLSNAHLQRAILVGAHLERACLMAADLQVALLTRAYLYDAELDGACLQRAWLFRAHLHGADLTGARLEGAFLAGTEGLTQDQIEGAFGDLATKLPKGLTRPAHWMIQPAR